VLVTLTRACGVLVVDHLEHGDGPIAHGLDAEQRILPQNQAAIAGAVVQLVVSRGDEIAPAITLDGPAGGGDQRVDRGIVRRSSARQIDVSAGVGDEVCHDKSHSRGT
jgi:hypothetical protein